MSKYGCHVPYDMHLRMLCGKNKKIVHKKNLRPHSRHQGGGRVNGPVCHDVGLNHKFDPLAISFWALALIPMPSKGGNWDQRILQVDTRWITILQATIFPGINDAISFKPFL